MSLWSDDRGAAIQVGAIILFAFVIIAMTAYQASVVPSQNKEVEFNHNQRVQSQLQDVQGTIGSMPSVGDRRTVTVDLSTSYPARALFINPHSPTGALRTVGTGDERVSLEVRNATATDADAADFWNGSARNYSTGALVFRPNYNVYSSAPTTFVENSLVFNQFDDKTELTVNSQSLFDGEKISLVALRGEYLENAGTASVNVRPVSASTRTTTVADTNGDNVTISVVSTLSAAQWRTILQEEGEFYNQSSGGHVAAVRENGTVTLPSGDEVDVIEFRMELGESYTLQLSRVGVGDLPAGARSTNATYAIARTERVTTEEDVDVSVVVEVRDEYGNPKAGATVNATVAPSGAAGGSIVDSQLTTDEDGRVSFTYDAPDQVDGQPSKQDTVRVSISGQPTSGFDASTAANVTSTVTVENTDGSGVGGGGSGGGAYSVTFDNAPSDSWDVSTEGSTLTLTASTGPDSIEGVSTDFAVNDSSVATIASEDTQTDASGDADVTLNAQSNGPVAVYVGSSGSSDVINVTISGYSGGSNGAPSASFTISPSSPQTGESVTFDASGSSDSDGSIASYDWTFGDGNSASGQTTSHAYSDDGSYSVTLTVTDDQGATDSVTKTVSVSNRGPTASFTYSPPNPETGETVTFDATGSGDPDGSIATYDWTFGDGTSGSGQATSHTYSADGSYAVTLTVTDDDGETDSVTKTITVDNQAPNVEFTVSSSNPQTGQSVTFDGSGSSDPDGSIASYDWTFGDGNTASGASTSHAYADDGSYTVTLTVTDDDGATSSTTKTVTVQNQGPTAGFTWSCDGSSPTCSFDASGSIDPDGTVSTYSWDFGDGTTGSGQTASHTYSPPGTYTVTLTVTDDDGVTDTISKTVSTAGGINFGTTTTWYRDNSVIEQPLSSSRNDDVTIIAVKVNETKGSIRELNGEDVTGGPWPEVEVYDFGSGSGRIGEADQVGGYTLPANMSLSADGTTALLASGEGRTLYLNGFKKNGGPSGTQPVDMQDETVTITITYRVNGVTYQKKVTVSVQ